MHFSTYAATTLSDVDASLHHFTWISVCHREIEVPGSALLGEPQPFVRKTDSRKMLIKLLLTSLETVTQTMILDQSNFTIIQHLTIQPDGFRLNSKVKTWLCQVQIIHHDTNHTWHYDFSKIGVTTTGSSHKEASPTGMILNATICV